MKLETIALDAVLVAGECGHCGHVYNGTYQAELLNEEASCLVCGNTDETQLYLLDAVGAIWCQGEVIGQNQFSLVNMEAVLSR